MITFPLFVAAVGERDVEQLARESGVCAASIRALLAGGVVPSLSVGERLAHLFGSTDEEMFAPAPHLVPALDGAPSRYVTDPATLRLIDRR